MRTHRSGLFAALVSASALWLVACEPTAQDARSSVAIVDPAVVRLGDAVVAEVDGTPIYVSDVRREALNDGLIEGSAQIDPSSPLFDSVLDKLVQRRILALEAMRRNLDTSDEARRRFSEAREVILSGLLVDTVIDEAVTESDLRTMYETQIGLQALSEEVRARHILVETKTEADEIVALARAGDDFAQLALERSLDDDTRFEGGDLGYFTAEVVWPPQPVVDSAFAADVGAVAAPVQSELGWHVVKVEERRAEQAPTFEEMRPDLVRWMVQEELLKLKDVLGSRAEVKRFAGPAAGGDGRDR